MRIRMLHDRTGPRWDGQDWPPVGGELDVPDEEGMALCGQGIAVPVVTDEVETPEEPMAAAVEVRSAEVAADEPDDGGFLPPESAEPAAADEPVEPDEPPALESQPAKPIVNAPKADWVDYAVSIGGDRAGAEASTKADLIQWVKDKEG